MAKYYKQSILPQIASRMVEFGFGPHPKEGVLFIQKCTDGHLGIFVRPVYYRPDTISIEVQCCISISIVQTFLIEIGYLLDVKPSQLTWTCGINIGELTRGHFHAWDMTYWNGYVDEDMIQAVVSEIGQEVREHGMPYMLSRATEPQMLDAASAASQPLNIEFIFPAKQVLVGMILASRTGNWAKVERLNMWGEKFFREFRDDDRDLVQFQRHAAALQQLLRLH